MKINRRNQHEIEHFSTLEHIWWGALTPAGQRRYDNKLEVLKKMTKIKKSWKVLEIGCGDGEFTRRLAKTGAQIWATDITPKVVRKGKVLIKAKNIKWKVEDSEKLSFKTGTFDLVCGVSILHHIETEKALKECYRVLKPSGMIFFTEPNKINPHILIGHHIPFFRKIMEFSPDETALIRWKTASMLQRIGFSAVKVSNYDFLHPKTPAQMISLVEKIGSVLEKVPALKEISGSLTVWAQK